MRSIVCRDCSEEPRAGFREAVQAAGKQARAGDLAAEPHRPSPSPRAPSPSQHPAVAAPPGVPLHARACWAAIPRPVVTNNKMAIRRNIGLTISRRPASPSELSHTPQAVQCRKERFSGCLGPGVASRVHSRQPPTSNNDHQLRTSQHANQSIRPRVASTP